MPDTALRPLDALTEARVHLAAALRLATLHELEEGIDNHFTVSVPGREGQYLILPFGLHWSEARASDMVVFDDKGATLEGTGKVAVTSVGEPVLLDTSTETFADPESAIAWSGR